MNARNDAQFSAAVRSLAASVGFHDPAFPGELATLFDVPGRKLRFLRARGVTVDGFGELLVDRGLTPERLAVNDVLALLGTVFDGTSWGESRKARGSVAALEAAELKAKKNRMRKFECSCGQILRGTRASSAICGLCYEMEGEIRFMRRVDPLPEEIREQSAQLGGGWDR